MITATLPGAAQQPVFQYRPVGSARELMRTREPEVLAVGPAGTGKTLALCWKEHLKALKYPGFRGLFVRKTLESLKSGALNTYINSVQPMLHGVQTFGGSKFFPAEFRYPNGSVILVSGMDKAEKILSAEFDSIYCFVGDTVVDSPSAIEKGYRREYSGELITIETSAGDKLTGTPNHPVLTDHGWVALGELEAGSNVISRSRGQEVLVGNPHVDDRPTTIAEVTRSLHLSEMGHTQRVRGGHMDFHGDGCDGYVDVISANSEFQPSGETSLAQPSSKHLVGGIGLDKFPLKRLGTLLEHRLTALLPLSRIGRYIGERLNPFRITLSPQVCGFTHGERLESASAEFGLERRVTDANALRNPGNPRFPFEVSTDRIIHISRCHSDERNVRHVYNLQTADHYYVANNIIVHNCNEATELTEQDYDTLKTRLRNGKMPYQQIVMDCNPSGPRHWLNVRCNEGRIQRITSTHKDNPVYWDAARDAWTEAGREYVVNMLGTLTGVTRQRLLDGTWAAAEGLVYPEFTSANVQAVDTEGWRCVFGVDIGSKNPTAILVAMVAGDGRVHISDMLYRRNMSAADIVQAISEYADRFDPDTIYIDPSAKAYIEDLWRGGYPAKPAVNDVLVGIQRVHALLQTGLTVDPSCTDLIDEFGMYVYPAISKFETDKPAKEHDHALDALRYLAMGISDPVVDWKVFFG